LQYTFVDILVYSLTQWNKFLLHYTYAAAKTSVNVVFVSHGRIIVFFEAGEN